MEKGNKGKAVKSRNAQLRLAFGLAESAMLIYGFFLSALVEPPFDRAL